MRSHSCENVSDDNYTSLMVKNLKYFYQKHYCKGEICATKAQQHSFEERIGVRGLSPGRRKIFEYFYKYNAFLSHNFGNLKGGQGLGGPLLATLLVKTCGGVTLLFLLSLHKNKFVTWL